MQTRLYRLYDEIEGVEKKEFLNSFVEQVDIYEQEQPDGRFLKHIKFRFPVYFNGAETEELSWDNESTVETVCLLSRKQAVLQAFTSGVQSICHPFATVILKIITEQRKGSEHVEQSADSLPIFYL